VNKTALFGSGFTFFKEVTDVFRDLLIIYLFINNQLSRLNDFRHQKFFVMVI